MTILSSIAIAEVYSYCFVDAAQAGCPRCPRIIVSSHDRPIQWSTVTAPQLLLPIVSRPALARLPLETWRWMVLPKPKHLPSAYRTCPSTFSRRLEGWKSYVMRRTSCRLVCTNAAHSNRVALIRMGVMYEADQGVFYQVGALLRE